MSINLTLEQQQAFEKIVASRIGESGTRSVAIVWDAVDFFEKLMPKGDEFYRNKVTCLEAELALVERERDQARAATALALKLVEARTERLALAEKRCKSLEESTRRLLAERDA